MEKHFIRADQDDFHEAEREPVLAYVEPAKPEHVAALLALPMEGEDNRSPWVWVRLRNGDLMLATFPQGETFEQFSQGEGVAHY